MTRRVLTSRSPKETAALGERLGRHLGRGDVVCLIGDLGSGKTLFTKGIAKGLGVRKPDAVLSPTFVIAREVLGGRVPLYHLDLYRLDRLEELGTTGFEEYLWGDGVCVVEWAEKIESLCPSDRVEVDFKVSGVTDRKIKLKATGPWSKKVLEKLRGLSLRASRSEAKQSHSSQKTRLLRSPKGNPGAPSQ